MAKDNFKLFIFLSILVFFVAAYFFVQRVILTENERVETPHFLQSEQLPIEEDAKVTLFLVGDIMLGRTVEVTARENNDFIYPFRKVADEMQKADITFANLENPIVSNCPRHTDGFKFCASPEMADGLVFAGVDIVSLANNHSRNYGQKGIDETIQILSAKSIPSTGLGQLIVFDKRGTRFGFLGFDFTVQKMTQADLQLIRDSDPKVDLLIVAPHWGVEYRDKPENYQREWAKQMVDAGGDVISGAHPHWVQISENINGPDGVSRPVYYSLGNFIFDQMWSEPTKKGLAVRLTFEGTELEKEELLPVYIRQRGQPEFVSN